MAYSKGGGFGMVGVCYAKEPNGACHDPDHKHGHHKDGTPRKTPPRGKAKSPGRHAKGGGPDHEAHEHGRRRRRGPPVPPRPLNADPASQHPATVAEASASVESGPFPPNVDPTRPALIHGGGIDSSAMLLLLHVASADFVVIHYHYGQPTTHEECAVIRQQCVLTGRERRCINIPPAAIAGTRPEEYRNRNMALLSYTWTFADRVYFGATEDCVFPDSGIDFLESVARTARIVNPKAELVTPVFHLHKGQELFLIRAIGSRGFPWWTCNRGVDMGAAVVQCMETPNDPKTWCSHCRDAVSWLGRFPGDKPNIRVDAFSPVTLAEKALEFIPHAPPEKKEGG